MKKTLGWTAAVVATAVAGVYLMRAIARLRSDLKGALGRAEAVTDRTRETLAEAQSAIHDARSAL